MSLPMLCDVALKTIGDPQNFPGTDESIGEALLGRRVGFTMRLPPSRVAGQ